MNDSRCGYEGLIPQEAQVLIAFREQGNGPNRFTTERYFFLGSTGNEGIAISAEKNILQSSHEAHYCPLSHDEIEILKDRISRLSLSIGGNSESFLDGSIGTLHINFPHSHSLVLHWNSAADESWTPVFSIIEDVETIISRSPATKRACALEFTKEWTTEEL